MEAIRIFLVGVSISRTNCFLVCLKVVIFLITTVVCPSLHESLLQIVVFTDSVNCVFNSETYQTDCRCCRLGLPPDWSWSQTTAGSAGDHHWTTVWLHLHSLETHTHKHLNTSWSFYSAETRSNNNRPDEEERSGNRWMFNGADCSKEVNWVICSMSVTPSAAWKEEIWRKRVKVKMHENINPTSGTEHVIRVENQTKTCTEATECQHAVANQIHTTFIHLLQYLQQKFFMFSYKCWLSRHV